MTRRRSATEAAAYPADWTVSLDWTHHGRHVSPGVELSVTGERGRFRFVKHVRRDDGAEWLDVVGGPTGHASFRSFRPARVRTVHRLTKGRPAAAK